MVQQFHFLTVCLVAALLANAAMANDGASANANNANDCIKDYQSGYEKTLIHVVNGGAGKALVATPVRIVPPTGSIIPSLKPFYMRSGEDKC
jgi:hypothetical protein